MVTLSLSKSKLCVVGVLPLSEDVMDELNKRFLSVHQRILVLIYLSTKLGKIKKEKKTVLGNTNDKQQV